MITLDKYGVSEFADDIAFDGKLEKIVLFAETYLYK